MFAQQRTSQKRSNDRSLSGEFGLAKAPPLSSPTAKPIQGILRPEALRNRIPADIPALAYENNKELYDNILGPLREYVEMVDYIKKEKQRYTDPSEVLERLSRAVYAWFDRMGIEKQDYSGNETRDVFFRVMFDTLDEIGWAYAMWGLVNRRGVPPWSIDKYSTPMGPNCVPHGLWTVSNDDHFLGKCEYLEGCMDGDKSPNFSYHIRASFMRLMAAPAGRKLLDDVTETDFPSTMFYPTAGASQPVGDCMGEISKPTAETKALDMKTKPMPICKVPVDAETKDSTFLRKGTDWERHFDVSFHEMSIAPAPETPKKGKRSKRGNIDDWVEVEASPRFRETEGHYVLSPLFINVAEALLIHLYKRKPWKAPEHNDASIYPQIPELSGWKTPMHLAVSVRLNEIRREHGLPEYKYNWVGRRE
ncbi:hypothetical protein FUAX_43420 (plasmid) [Fulvitalea axinellae]|uniref:Uncharacterized protein n=1 Tax=Fulvitalea axinellae TaxID=1182444 RepID=A0AAU9DH76_9BACT|nr:hypothetical protein FUAX_43420 [Fulvitalea axinellae]